MLFLKQPNISIQIYSLFNGHNALRSINQYINQANNLHILCYSAVNTPADKQIKPMPIPFICFFIIFAPERDFLINVSHKSSEQFQA